MALCAAAAALLLSACTTAAVAPAHPAGTLGVERVEISLHPSGPVRRTEWRRAEGGQLQRVHIAPARSGQQLVGLARLLQINGRWLVDHPPFPGFSGQAQPVPVVGQSTLVMTTSGFWMLHVHAEHTPPRTPGIANEALPSLELTLTRQAQSQ